MSKPNFAKMLAALAEAAGKDEPRLARPEQIEKLRAAAPRFQRENPFKIGHMVTPVAGGCIQGAGDPCLVIATRPDSFDPRVGTVDEPSFGSVPDLRVICFSPAGNLRAYWVRSEAFEPYVAPETPVAAV